MKISEAIILLENLKKLHGDLKIGAINQEFEVCRIADFEVRESNRIDGDDNYFMDDKELGAKFILCS